MKTNLHEQFFRLMRVFIILALSAASIYASGTAIQTGTGYVQKSLSRINNYLGKSSSSGDAYL